MLKLELDVLLGLEGLPCWHLGGMKLIASSWSMMLLRTWDSEGSGTGESLADMGGLLGCLLGCLLAQKEVNVKQVIVSIE